jgi:hypothetical protein
MIDHLRFDESDTGLILAVSGIGIFVSNETSSRPNKNRVDGIVLDVECRDP